MSDTTKLLALSLFLLLGACKETKCERIVNDSAAYQSAFDHCMDKASKISKAGTHDNSYNTVEECQAYASLIDTAQCIEKNHE